MEQEKAIRAYFEGKDIYFSAPTGYGKSLIFKSLPVFADSINQHPPGYSTLIVISPLKSLMMDQVNYLKSIGITAESLVDDNEKSWVIDPSNLPSLLYSSPECLLSVPKWRDLLVSKDFREKCIGVVIDEAHCITTW